MTSRIKILDKKTINQIAAGEVVERPASVVKELLENSIDANSRRIVIELESAGKKLIRITDDGSGIPPEELKVAFEKHSTSKITNINDVYKLSTLGFRGEALASIAAVALVECISCVGKISAGRRLVLDGGNIKSFSELGCAKGTTIKVKNLFYNLPARLKYLKSDQTELAHIIDIITQMAIYHHAITFKVIHNGHELLNLPSTKNQINNLVNIYGKELVRELLPIRNLELEIENGKIGRIIINGFIGKPSITRSDRSYQSIYVNGRYVDSKAINDAIKESYRSLVMKNRFPLVILFLEADPGRVDVNISPTKLQVRFENEKGVFNAVYKNIHETLKNNDLIPEVKLPQKPHTVTLKAITTLGIGKPGYLPEIPNQLNQRNQYKQHNQLNESDLMKQPKQGDRPDINLLLKTQIQRTLKPEHELEVRTHQENLKGAKTYSEPSQLTPGSMLSYIHPIGQVLDTYIIAQSGENLLIIDQHAAAERIMYEKIKRRYTTMTMSTQELLEPIELELAPKELGLLRSSLDTLKELSFIIDELGENRFYVKGIPIILGRLQDREIIHDIINDLIKPIGEKQHEQIKDKMIQIMACKAAIKAGKPLNIPEIQQLLNELYSIENPYTCAHGRPTIISLTDNQLRKLFKRIV